MGSRRSVKKIIITIIVIAAIAAGSFWLGKNNAGSETTQTGSDGNTVYSDTSDLRKEMNLKLAEHVALTSEAMRASYDDHAISTAAIDELDKNSQELAGIIGKFYGEEPKATFLKQWRDHITFFINYTVSTKNDDKEGKEQALSDLEEYSQKSAEFFAGLNSSLGVDSLKSLFADYRDIMIESANDYKDGDYSGSLDKQSQAYSQAGKLADTLSDGMSKQFPDKFSQ